MFLIQIDYRHDISLPQRFIYLSHAVICAESTTEISIRAGIEDLKDKLEVTRIQLSIK